MTKGEASSEKPTGDATSAVSSVELEQSGGFAGVVESFVVDRGVADQRREELFGMVGSQQFRALKETYSVESGCRDQFSYRVVVAYADATTKEVSTDDCSQSPQLLTDVRTLVKQIGVPRK
ncbi:protealysin inhibitor emfourin [Nocardia sp. NPDC052566]|uniref:protealysin inhibitor emfourin n=1 Tax=Nocardia sp. NPDC052566 TaxID=3364330 RepID=UPI0037CC7D0E